MIDLERFEELIKQSRKAERVDRERAELFALMLRHPAWPEYVKLLDTRLQMFSDELLRPLQSMDQAGLQEFAKGAMFAFVLMRDLPSNIIAAMKGEDHET